MTEYLSPKDYGVLAIFNATTRLFVAILSLGSLNILMVKLIEERKSNFKSYLTSFLGIITGNTLLLFIILGISSFFLSDFFGLPIWLMLTLPFFAWFILVYEGMTTLLMYQKKLKAYATLTLSKFFSEILIALCLIILLDFNWTGRISGLSISLILSFIVTFFLLKQQQLTNGKFEKTKYKELIKHGYPLVSMSLSIMIMNLSDRFYIESMLNINETGIYSIGAIIGGIELIVVNAVMGVLRPLIYKSLKVKKNTFNLQLLNLIILVFTAFCILLPLDLIYYFLDESYSASKVYVLPIVIGFIFWGIYNFYISYFIYNKNTKSIAIISITGVILNLILNYYFIHSYQTIGAAYATTLTYFIMASLIFIMFVLKSPNANHTEADIS